MTPICSRRTIAPLLANLVLLGTLAGCGSGDDAVPSTLSVATSSLPNGQVGSSYSGALAATGGTAPYHWALANGTLPPGLTLSASGTIAGTPSAAVNAAAIDVQVTDSGSPAQSSARSLTLTIAPAVLFCSHELIAAGSGWRELQRGARSRGRHAALSLGARERSAAGGPYARRERHDRGHARRGRRCGARRIEGDRLGEPCPVERAHPEPHHRAIRPCS